MTFLILIMQCTMLQDTGSALAIPKLKTCRPGHSHVAKQIAHVFFTVQSFILFFFHLLSLLLLLAKRGRSETQCQRTRTNLIKIMAKYA